MGGLAKKKKNTEADVRGSKQLGKVVSKKGGKSARSQKSCPKKTFQSTNIQETENGEERKERGDISVRKKKKLLGNE